MRQRNIQTDKLTDIFHVFHSTVHFWSKYIHLVKEVLKNNHCSLHVSETHKATLILERERDKENMCAQLSVCANVADLFRLLLALKIVYLSLSHV